MKYLFNLIKHDVINAYLRNYDVLYALSFFLLIAVLYPFVLGNDPETLRLVGIGVIWTAALLVSIIALPYVFDADFNNGVLEQLWLLPFSPYLVVLGKVIAYWLAFGIPTAVASPFVLLLYGFDLSDGWLLLLSLLLGTFALSLINVMAAAIMLGARKAGVLAALLVVPLAIAVVIMGVGMALPQNASYFLLHASGQLGLVLILLPVSIWSSTAAIASTLEDY